MTTPIFLAHRSIISVTGADAEPFLNNIVTVSTAGIVPGELRYGALLSPQGKVIADMLLAREGEAILIDCDAGAAPALARRLALMKLRAAVAIEERPDLGVRALDHGRADPRALLAPTRSIVPRGEPSDPAVYHAQRIAAGLAEQGIDFGVEEVFPADINMDLCGGVDFRKGCFVGQEVVSRMKRRGTARRRTLKAFPGPGTTPSPILANGFEIGVLTSISGGAGLARVRIDRLADAQAKGETITMDGAPIAFDQPDWLAGELAAIAEAKEAKA